MRARPWLALVLGLIVACEPGQPETNAARPEAGGRIVAVWYRQPGHGGPVRWDGMTIVDLATNTVEDRRLPEYAAGDVQFKLVRIADRLVFRGSRPQGRGRVATDYGTYSIEPGLEERADFLGRSWYFVPSSTHGRVWLASFDRRPRESGGYLHGAREVDLSGGVTQRAVRPPDRPLVGALTGGLLLQGDRRMRLWDPRARRVIARIPGSFPVAQRGDAVASCSGECPSLVISDGAGKVVRRLAPPDGWTFEATYDGSFSPNGRLIATAITKGGLRRLALVEVEGGRAVIVEGARLDRGFGVSAWSKTGEWVVFNSGAGRLTAYHLESGELRTFALGEDHVVMALTRGI